MSIKKPILVTIDGITKTLIHSAKCGYFSPPENVENFKKTILKIASTPHSDLDTLGQNGYNYVRKHFNRETIAKTYLNEIKDLMNH